MVNRLCIRLSYIICNINLLRNTYVLNLYEIRTAIVEIVIISY